MWMPWRRPRGGIEERVDAHAGLRHEPDRVHHAVELVAAPMTSGDPAGQRVEMLVVLHVEFQQRRRVRQPVGDALDQLHPVEPGEHQLGARLLGHLRDVERDRGVGDDPRDEDPLTFQKPCHCRPISQWISGGDFKVRGPVAHAHAAVDRDHRAGDVAGILRGQEADRPGDLSAVPRPAWPG